MHDLITGIARIFYIIYILHTVHGIEETNIYKVKVSL